MSSWNTPVDKARALRLICPLPDGTVTGLQQIARRGETVIIASLAPTIRQDTWAGLQIHIVSPAAGTIARNLFTFAEHDVFDESHDPRKTLSGELTRATQQDLLQVARIRADRLRDAVEVYTTAFAPPPAPEFVAMAQVEGLSRLAKYLDHLGSTTPSPLKGQRAFEHAEALREVAREVYLDLKEITGERRAADGGQVTLSGSLEILHKVQAALTELTARLDRAADGDRADRFRHHAAILEGIEAEISNEIGLLPAPRSSERQRVAALISSSPASSAGPRPPSVSAQPRPAHGPVTGRGAR